MISGLDCVVWGLEGVEDLGGWGAEVRIWGAVGAGCELDGVSTGF